MSTRGYLTRYVRAAGKRMTRERELILRVIEENRHLGANEIYRLASTKNPRLNLSTVYRTMALLREMGLVDASPLGEDHGHFEARGDAHHHAVCLGCSRVIEIPTDGWIADLASREGFKVTSAKVELLGYCAACQVDSPKIRGGRRKGAPPVGQTKARIPHGSPGEDAPSRAHILASAAPRERNAATPRPDFGRGKNS